MEPVHCRGSIGSCEATAYPLEFYDFESSCNQSPKDRERARARMVLSSGKCLNVKRQRGQHSRAHAVSTQKRC